MPKESLLKSFSDNPLLVQALKELILVEFETDFDTAMDNENLGAIVRANIDGRKKVETAFTKLESLKSLQDEKPTLNPAR